MNFIKVGNLLFRSFAILLVCYYARLLFAPPLFALSFFALSLFKKNRIFHSFFTAFPLLCPRANCSVALLYMSDHEWIAISLFCKQKYERFPRKTKEPIPNPEFPQLWRMLIDKQKYKLVLSAKSATSSAIFYFILQSYSSHSSESKDLKLKIKMFCVWQFLQFSLFCSSSLLYSFIIYFLALEMQLNRNIKQKS